MNYLKYIKTALTKFYKNDAILMQGKLHEMTFCFRLAKYLSEQLECGDKRIDCEYHGMVDDMVHVRKAISGKNIRPDIIFHKRSSVGNPDKNIFAIEVKLGSPGEDREKMREILHALNYNQGFCVCNVGERFVTVYALHQESNFEEKYRYKVKNIGTPQAELEKING